MDPVPVSHTSPFLAAALDQSLLGRDRQAAMVSGGAGEQTVAHGHKPGCLMTSEEEKKNAHAKQMMAMQWLQSSHD